MATVIRTIGPDGAPTYDYASLSAWQVGEQTDLVAAGDTHVAECYKFAGGLDDNVTVDGWITGASNRIHIKPAAGEEHDGTPQSGFYMKKSVNFGRVIDVLQDYVDLTALDIEQTNNNGNGIRVDPDTSGNAGIINRCIGKCSRDTQNVFSALKAAEFRNCLAYGSGRGFEAANFFVMTCSNCTSADQGFGFRTGNSSKAVIKNCCAYNNSTDYSDGGSGWDASCTNNATSSSTEDPPGPNSVLNIVSGDFADAANNDFHLSGTGSALYAAALDQSVDYTDDIDGDTRVQWDIGADEFVGGPPTPIEIDINDLRHARPVDQVDVTEVVTIIPIDIDNMRHGRRVDSVTLSVEFTLFVSGLRHDRSVDTINLEVSVELNISSLRHGRAVDVVDVQPLVGIVFDVSDQRHGRPVDSLLLDVDQPILIDGLRHGRQVDTVGVQPLLGDQTGIGATTNNWILDAGQPLNNATSVDFDYHVLEGIFDSDQSVLGVDGTRVTGSAGMRELTALTLGANVDGQERVQGEIAELRIYAGTLSQIDRDRILQELTVKWITG